MAYIDPRATPQEAVANQHRRAADLQRLLTKAQVAADYSDLYVWELEFLSYHRCYALTDALYHEIKIERDRCEAVSDIKKRAEDKIRRAAKKAIMLKVEQIEKLLSDYRRRPRAPGLPERPPPPPRDDDGLHAAR